MRKLLLLIGSLTMALIIGELVMRNAGSKPGYLIDNFVILDSIIEEPVQVADSLGIIHYVKKSPWLPSYYNINEEGFLSNINYTPSTIDSIRGADSLPIIMLVGDSYTEGCCLDSAGYSFADLLASTKRFTVLNFGIGTSDPYQYNAITNKWCPIVKPNAVLIFVYLGNDIMQIERKLHPYIPVTYRIKGTDWLQAYPGIISEYPYQYFSNAKDAYDFKVRNFTLFGPNRTWWSKIVSHSVVMSKFVLVAKNIKHILGNLNYMPPKYKLTNEVLRNVAFNAYKNGSKAIFIPIPAPSDVKAQTDLKREYGEVFAGLNCYYPNISQFNLLDYDGEAVQNHFNKQGYKKFFYFLDSTVIPNL
ncbi:MAG: SGNH/GDSL hydrolase family protein [Chitinophagales bacterium]